MRLSSIRYTLVLYNRQPVKYGPEAVATTAIRALSCPGHRKGQVLFEGQEKVASCLEAKAEVSVELSSDGDKEYALHTCPVWRITAVGATVIDRVYTCIHLYSVTENH